MGAPDTKELGEAGGRDGKRREHSTDEELNTTQAYKIVQDIENAPSAAVPSASERNPNVWDDVLRRNNIALLCYTGGMSFTVVLQLLMVFVTYLLEPDIFQPDYDGRSATNYAVVLTLATVVQFVSFTLIAVATFQVGKDFEAKVSDPSAIAKVFFASTVAFCGGYFTCVIIDSKTLTFPEDVASDRTVFSIAMRCFYYSTAVMTSVGYGDETLRHAWALIIVDVQMLLANIYAVGFFAICLHQFRQRKREAPGLQFRRRGWLGRCMKYLRTNVPGLERLRKLVVKYLLAFTFGLELINVIMFLSSESHPFRHDGSVDNTRYVIASLLLQCIQLFVIILVSIRLTQKLRSREVSASFLVQSFLSTVLLFAGIYFSIMLVDTRSFGFFDLKTEDYGVENVGMWLLYFSISTQTTTGFGDVVPVRWSSQLVVSLQMFTAFLYQVVILGLGMVHVIKIVGRQYERRYSTRRLPGVRHSASFSLSTARNIFGTGPAASRRISQTRGSTEGRGSMGYKSPVADRTDSMV